MKLAFAFSILFHLLIFFIDISISHFFEKKLIPLAKNNAKGIIINFYNSNNNYSNNKVIGKKQNKSILFDEKIEIIKNQEIKNEYFNFSTNTKNNLYREYYFYVFNKIKNKLQELLISKGNIEILIEILKNGKINNIKILKSNFNNIFISEIIDNIKLIKFNSFPETIFVEKLLFKIIIEYN